MNRFAKTFSLFIFFAFFLSSTCMAAVQKQPQDHGTGTGTGSPQAPPSNSPTNPPEIPEVPKTPTFPQSDFPPQTNTPGDQDGDKSLPGSLDQQRQEQYEKCRKSRLTDPNKEAFCKCSSGLETENCQQFPEATMRTTSMNS